MPREQSTPPTTPQAAPRSAGSRSATPRDGGSGSSRSGESRSAAIPRSGSRSGTPQAAPRSGGSGTSRSATPQAAPRSGSASRSRSATPQAAPRSGGSGPAARDGAAGAEPVRLAVRKTYKLFVGGKFPRSESGRSYQVRDAGGGFLANAAQASRKDVRDAVVAARKAFGGWSGATAYNRGQILYRIAELLEGRRGQFADEIEAAEGVPGARAAAAVDAAIDRWVWYAGWADKIAQVYGNANPVAGPYFNLSSPEPTGVVGIVAPEVPLLGLVSVVAPAIVSGNTAVVLASERHPLPAVTLAEVLATSDLPGGVVNLLTGRTAETAPWLAGHADVNALDLTGITDADLAVELERLAAETLTRVLRPALPADWSADPGTGRITAFLETKTVWHPKGM